MTKRESASGLDGTSCNVHRSAGDFGPTFLSVACQACLQGVALPAGFGASRTLFIPKSSEEDDQGRIIRAPEALRPFILYATVIAK